MITFVPSQVKEKVESLSQKIDFLQKEYEKTRQLELEIKNINSEIKMKKLLSERLCQYIKEESQK